MLRILVVTVGWLALFAPWANAGVEATRADARIQIAPSALPAAVADGQWSFFVWIYAPQAIDAPATVLQVDGRLGVAALPDGLFVFARDAGRAVELSLDAPLRAGRWHLLACSVDAAGGTASAWLASELLGEAGAEVVSATGALERRDARGVVPSGAGLVVGSTSTATRAARVVYETLVVRDHPVNDADVHAVWASRDVFAAHSLDTRGEGGTMGGWAGAPLVAFHGVATEAFGSGSAFERRSWIGGPATAGNVLMLTEPTARDDAGRVQFRRVGPVAWADGFVYRSRLEPRLAGFFRLQPPPFDAPREPVGPAGPKAASLVAGPSGLVRVIVSANSRGVRGTLLPQPGAESFAEGLIAALRPRVAGVLARPATIQDSRGGFFAFDTRAGDHPADGRRVLHARTDELADFTRFASGTLPGISRGPGPAVLVSPGGFDGMRARPEDGSLLVADAPLAVRAHVLAFPGSSALRAAPEVAVSQSAAGEEVGPRIPLDLDTTRVVRTLTEDDVLVTPTTLALVGSVDVRPGDALVVRTAPGMAAVSVATGVFDDGAATTVELSHPFGGPIEAGDEVRIGPWRFESVRADFGPVPAGDARVWRGLSLHAADDGGLGLLVHAYSAWRPGVDGFVIGAAGQSGRGYDPQLDNAFPGSTGAWAAAIGAEVWIQAIAPQSSSPPAMRRYLDALRAGLPDDAEVLWASDGVQGGATQENWHRYIRDNAEDAGVAAVFAVGHPAVGSYFAQLSSGLRTDDAHYAHFGAATIARAWLDQLRVLVLGECAAADFDASGRADLFDLIAFQQALDAGDRRADFNADGRLDVFDLTAFADALGPCAR